MVGYRMVVINAGGTLLRVGSALVIIILLILEG